MPQSERSQILKELLRWLHAKTVKDGGASRSEIIHFVMVDITELGCTKRRAEAYLQEIVSLGFVSIYRLKFKTTKVCENWLEVHT